MKNPLQKSDDEDDGDDRDDEDELPDGSQSPTELNKVKARKLKAHWGLRGADSCACVCVADRAVTPPSECLLALSGDAAPPGGWPGTAAVQQPEGSAGESGGNLDLLSLQPAHRPRGGGAAGTEDQMFW